MCVSASELTSCCFPEIKLENSLEDYRYHHVEVPLEISLRLRQRQKTTKM